MKNFKKIVAVMAAAMMTVGCLAGCGSDAPSGETAETPAQEAGDEAQTEAPAESEAGGDEVTLTFWSWLPTTDQSEEMIAAFEEANPGIKSRTTILRNCRLRWHPAQVPICSA